MVAADYAKWFCLRARSLFARSGARTSLPMGIEASIIVGSLAAVGMSGLRFGSVALGPADLALVSVAVPPPNYSKFRIPARPDRDLIFSVTGALSRGPGTNQVLLGSHVGPPSAAD